jgi:ankyrin repeat protein
MTDLLAYDFNLLTEDFLAQFRRAPSPFLHESLMHELAREGDVLSAEIMFEDGHALDQPDDQGRKPLHEAAFFGHAEMVKFLLIHGAQINTPIHPFGHTALYLAVQNSHYDTVKLLIACGARLNCADSLNGEGLLHLAAAKDDIKMAGILIAAGADIFRETKKGLTARDLAARNGHKQLESILLKVMEHHAKYDV